MICNPKFTTQLAIIGDEPFNSGHLKFLASGKIFSGATSRTCDLLFNPGGMDFSSGYASVNTGRFSLFFGVRVLNKEEKL
jgi:hypothetical protein